MRRTSSYTPMLPTQITMQSAGSTVAYVIVESNQKNIKRDYESYCIFEFVNHSFVLKRNMVKIKRTGYQ